MATNLMKSKLFLGPLLLVVALLWVILINILSKILYPTPPGAIRFDPEPMQILLGYVWLIGFLVAGLLGLIFIIQGFQEFSKEKKKKNINQ
jgi:hypothetical protein